MFAFLRGRVAAKPLDHIQLDVNGVGYLVFVPGSVHAKLALDSEATLLTYCHIREDAFQIFGFLQEEQKTLFTMLLSVSGIGPKVALSILSQMPPSAFGNAVRQSDVTAFTKVSGVGKKTAQRLILEMKAKLGQDAELDAILGESANADNVDDDDVVAALLALGCTPAEAKRAAMRARKKSDKDASDEELVRMALQSLAKV
jgi:Holliday junction DNA helicase RuvA